MLRVLTVLDDPIAPICSKICGTAAAVRGPTNPTTIASHPTARVNCTVAPSGRDASHRGVAGVKLYALFQQLGGSDMVSKLSSSFLQKAVKDPRLSGLLGKVNPGDLSPKVSQQMCAMLGGDCKAPLTDQQIAAGEKKLDPNQKKALSDNFSSALGSVGGNPLAKEGVARMLGPKMGGIVGALIH